MKETQKSGRYQRIYQQIEKLIVATENPTARMATIAAILHHKFDYFFWTGFYNLIDGELIVGAYQGPVACLKLKKDTGVCWAGINKKDTIIVPNVHEFPGHIACNSLSASEIVIPVKNKCDEIIGVLDVDSRELDSFDAEDAAGLENIVSLIFI